MADLRQPRGCRRCRPNRVVRVMVFGCSAANSFTTRCVDLLARWSPFSSPSRVAEKNLHRVLHIVPTRQKNQKNGAEQAIKLGRPPPPQDQRTWPFTHSAS